MNILLVDDEYSYRFLVKNALEEENWTVYETENGQDAIDILLDNKIDMIVSDVFMPSMDGVKLHKNVRAMSNYQRIPFLFVSAFDDNHTMGAIRDITIEGFVKKGKPVSFIKEWIHYLTMPIDKRPLTPPSEERKIKLDRYTRGGRNKGNNRTTVL